MRAAIFDIDGTLCDTSFRALRLSPIVRPTLLEAITAHEYALKQGLVVLVVTARRRLGAVPTRLWLRHHGIVYDRLYMRTVLDRRPDVAVKRSLFNEILFDGYEPVLAIDDKPEVLDLWREIGIERVIPIGDQGEKAW